MQKQSCLARPVHIVCSLEKLISSATSHCSAYPACLKPRLITISTFHSVQRGIIISDKICILFLCWSCITSPFPLPPELLPNLFFQLYLDSQLYMWMQIFNSLKWPLVFHGDFLQVLEYIYYLSFCYFLLLNLFILSKLFFLFWFSVTDLQTL